MATEKDYERLGVWAVMLNPDQNINRRGAKRTVPMEVLSLGLSRTGTATMQEAYSILGYENPYHFASIFANIQDCDMWNEAMRAKLNHGTGREKQYGRAEFDQLLGHCGAVTDSPACLFWEELIEAYPEAKVVLVSRDEDKWYKSFDVLLQGMLNPFGQNVLRYTDPYWFGRVMEASRLWITVFCGTSNINEINKVSREHYRKHYASVRAAVPKDQLLEYRLGSGWEPLCKFLGKKVPDVPFPHRNEANILNNAMGAGISKAIKHSVVNIGIVGVAVVSAVWVLRLATPWV